MHEVATVEALVEEALARTGLQGRVHAVSIAVRRPSGISHEAVRLAFEALSRGTRLEGAALKIEDRAAVLRCRRCGARQDGAVPFALCPSCGGRDLEMEGGGDLVVEGLEVE